MSTTLDDPIELSKPSPANQASAPRRNLLVDATALLQRREHEWRRRYHALVMRFDAAGEGDADQLLLLARESAVLKELGAVIADLAQDASTVRQRRRIEEAHVAAQVELEQAQHAVAEAEQAARNAKESGEPNTGSVAMISRVGKAQEALARAIDRRDACWLALSARRRELSDHRQRPDHVRVWAWGKSVT